LLTQTAQRIAALGLPHTHLQQSSAPTSALMDQDIGCRELAAMTYARASVFRTVRKENPEVQTNYRFDCFYFCETVSTWPVEDMLLGNRLYTKVELCQIIWSPSGGNVRLKTAHYLIYAKLNVASGAVAIPEIALADTQIGACIISPITGYCTAPANNLPGHPPSPNPVYEAFATLWKALHKFSTGQNPGCPLPEEKRK
jgi:hypothetical protein